MIFEILLLSFGVFLSIHNDILLFCRYQILDECDQMLNMGFVDDVELLLNAVEDRSDVQTLLFSATTPNWINSIAKKFLKPDHKRIDLVGDSSMQVGMSICFSKLIT